MRNKGQGQRLVIAQRPRPLAKGRIRSRARQLHHRAAVGGKRVLKLVIPVQPRDFLDHIDLALHVQSPARNMHTKLRLVLPLGNQREAQTLQQPKDFPRVEPLAQNPPHLAQPQHHRRLIHWPRHHIHHVAHQLAATRLQNHLRHQIAGQHRRFKIGSALEPVRSIRMHAVPPCHLPHNPRIPPRRLDHNVPRLGGNHRVKSAHHPRKPDRFSSVADDKIFRSQLALDAIQSPKRFAHPRLPYNNLPAF